MRTLTKTPHRFLIVVTYDSCDPQVYGVYKSESEAERVIEDIRSAFDDYDWNHMKDISVTKVMEVK